jgi:ABC-2 type transport system permease protein
VITTPTWESDFARGAEMPGSRLLRAYLTEAKYESVRMLRMPGFSIPFLLLPAALYLLFGVVLFGEALRGDPKGALFIFTGFDVMGVMGPGMFGFGITLAMEREQGLLALKRALPMPTGASLIAKMIMAMLFGVIVTATMITAALTLGHLPLTATQCLQLTTINALGALPFCALGLLLGTLTTARSAPAIINLLYLAMIYLSGFLIPLPKSIEWIALASPAFYLDQLALSALGAASHGAALTQIGVLAGVTLLPATLAIRRLARVG